MEIVQPVLGIVVFVAIAYLCSERRSAIRWKRTIIPALLMQFVIAALVLHIETVRGFFDSVGKGVNWLFQKVVIQSAEPIFAKLPTEVPFAFGGMLMVVFFCCLMTILYEVGLMHRIVYGVARVFRYVLGVSGAEAVSAVGNIILGQTEAPLLSMRYLATMTRSELLCVMTGGMATIAGSVMALYILWLQPYFPDISVHILTASIISAPAAIMLAKIILPETGVPETSGEVKLTHVRRCNGAFDTFETGLKDGGKLAINVVLMLFGISCLINLTNGAWGEACGFLTAKTGFQTAGFDTFQEIFGRLFMPVAWLMGVPAEETFSAGVFLAEKTILNEFIAYKDLATFLSGEPIAAGVTLQPLSQHSVTILTYALCGFSNFCSIGILVGGLGVFAPERKGEMFKLGFKALLAGSLACFITANVAAILG